MTSPRASMGVIGLDADGVLLDYHGAYRAAWHKAFGHWLDEASPDAYWPPERWGARQLTEPAELTHFRSCLDSEFWRTLEPMPGAVEACDILSAAGFDLVCVTALGPRFAGERLQNLVEHGMKIDSVHATGNNWNGQLEVSPKAKIIHLLSPVAFVDDFAPYLRGISPSVHRALVKGRPEGSPNIGADLALADTVHMSLLDFACEWVARDRRA